MREPVSVEPGLVDDTVELVPLMTVADVAMGVVKMVEFWVIVLCTVVVDVVLLYGGAGELYGGGVGVTDGYIVVAS